MEKEQAIHAFYDILKENTLKGLGFLIAYIGFQLFTVDKLWESLIFFLVAILAVTLGVMMQTSRHLVTNGVTTAKKRVSKKPKKFIVTNIEE